MASRDRVARYYDSNTGRFLLVGGRGVHAIHRELWGPGVSTVRGAADYINRLLEREILALGTGEDLTILDLGCGVGGTVLKLAEVFPESRLHGITISRRQHAIACRLAARRGLTSRASFWMGDFQALRLELEADVVIAVESFVHSDAPHDFFATANHHLRSGGHLIVVDDFVTTGMEPLAPRRQRYLEDFKTGWRVPSVGGVGSLTGPASAADFDLVKDSDLTPLIRLGRPRDRVIALLSPLLRRLPLIDVPFFGNMIGGHALQVGLREGFLEYRLLLYRKASGPDGGTKTTDGNPPT